MLELSPLIATTEQENCPVIVRRPGEQMQTAVTASKKWESRCFRYSPDNPSAIYYIKLMFRRRRHTFSTGTPIKATAGVVARKIFMSLQADGWDETIAKYAPHAQAQPVITIGDFCAKLQAVYTGRKRTINDYCRNFRRLVADIAIIERRQEIRLRHRRPRRMAFTSQSDTAYRDHA